jgi:4-hydroxyphenylacetate 3-monooxygenase
MSGSAEQPYTGESYLESLRDGREVWIYGERVADVTAHPAFRNPARMLARLYDALHDPMHRATLTAPTDTGNSGLTHPFFKISRTREELIQAREAIATWARLTYGWMGRSPDYKASFMVTLGFNPDYYAPYQDNARRWYARAQNTCMYLNHAIVNPPVDRQRPPEDVRDVYVRCTAERDDGIVVSGAKVVATGSALTHYNFLGQYGPTPLGDSKLAISGVVRMSAPGVKLICRPSYSYQAEVMGSPFDYPLSSRLDENDAILVLDEVLIPWEDVFIYGDCEKAQNFLPASGWANRFAFQGCTRLAVKLDFITGLLMKAVELTGTRDFRGVQVAVGETLAWRHLFWSLSDAMCGIPEQGPNGAMQPALHGALAYRVIATVAYPRIKELVENAVASGLIYLNSHAVDFKVPELRGYLDKYLRGSYGHDAQTRVKTMRALWDAIGTEFAGRHELYERNYAGNHENIRLENLWMAQGRGLDRELQGFAQRCLDEYDLDGWTVPDLINPTDVSRFLGGSGRT